MQLDSIRGETPARNDSVLGSDDRNAAGGENGTRQRIWLKSFPRAHPAAREEIDKIHRRHRGTVGTWTHFISCVNARLTGWVGIDLNALPASSCC